MTAEKFTKALCETLKNERPEVVMNLLTKVGIVVTENTPVMEVVHKLRGE